MRILFVDDMPDVRDVTKTQLENGGYVVDVADGAEQGLAALAENIPDLIVSDVFMPDMDGFEFCHRVKSNPDTRDIPFIFYTSTFVDPSDQRLGDRLGAVKFITKPVPYQDFLQQIHDAIINSDSDAKNEGSDVLDDRSFSREHSSILTRKLFDKTEELEQAEKEINVRHKQFYQLLNSIEEPVAEISEELCFEYVNNAFLNWLGLNRENVFGSDVAEVLGAPFREVFAQLESSEVYSDIPYVFDIAGDKLNDEATEFRANLFFNHSGVGEQYIVVFSTAGMHPEKHPATPTNIVNQVESALGRQRIGVGSAGAGGDGMGIVGQSPSFVKVIDDVKRVALSDCVVLLQGESGTGKELIANAIHAYSDRRDGVLIKVNCGAIVPGLFESELFGHEKGAFTSAVHRRVGRFEQANKGTIFLDEVSELPLDLQVKLLRVLQDGEFERVGGEQPIRVDTRVIVAANLRLDELVHKGRFRADLFYRLNVFPIDIPPLRERVGDIPLLAEKFLLDYSDALDGKYRTFSEEAMKCLLTYRWPGNIRQLQNVVERAVIVAQDAVIYKSDLNIEIQEGGLDSTGTTLQEVEVAHIKKILKQTNWLIAGKGGAAEILGMNPSTLRSRMQKYGIRRE